MSELNEPVAPAFDPTDLTDALRSLHRGFNGLPSGFSESGHLRSQTKRLNRPQFNVRNAISNER